MTSTPDISSALAGRMPVGDTHLTGLATRLGDLAVAHDLADVAYRTLDTPVGRLLLAATPRGVVRVAYSDGGEEPVLDELAARVSPRVVQVPARLDETARQLDEYFAGARHAFELPLDWQLATAFKLEVLEYLRAHVPFGATASYGDVATGIDHPRAGRAVGTACATNPLPVLVPCHRVILADGGVGEYVGGRRAKQTLLALEAA